MNNIESQIEKLRDEKEPYVGMPLPEINRYMDRHRDMDRNRCDMDRNRRDMDRNRRDMDRNRRDMDRRRDMENCDDDHIRCDPLSGMPLGMTYTPWQQWYETYEPEMAHHRGTIFPELDLPFLAGGDC